VRGKWWIGLVAGCLELGLAACAGDDADDHVHSDAGSAATPDRPEAKEERSAISPSCVPPADCLAIRSSFVNVGVCCSETLRCGFDLSILDGIGGAEGFDFDPSKPCWPRSDVFVEFDGLAERRVAAASGPDILTTPDCKGRVVVNTQLAGCCLPSDACGYSTHLAASAFAVLAGNKNDPFTGPECVSASELNAQLAASELAAWAYVPAAQGSCDYAAIDARLPPLD
jgi:hypothetical protein